MKNSFAFGVIVFSCLFNPSSHARLLELEKIVSGDQKYIEEIRPLFERVTEIQIGGTNTYGNKTIIKGSKPEALDPSILIINPDNKAHEVNNDTILGIRGSGFDLALIAQLKQASTLYKHLFKKIYINNLGFILPIPDKLPYFVSFGSNGYLPINQPQDRVFSDQDPSIIGAYFLEACFLVYLSKLSDNPHSYPLYAKYAELLQDGGEFWFKSASVGSLDGLFTQSFTYQRYSFSIPHFVQKKEIYFNELADRELLKTIQENLNEPGIFYVPSHALEGPLKPEDTRTMIKSQLRLLELSGFTGFKVGFGRLKDWMNPGVRAEAYSMIIKATKVKEHAKFK